MQITVHAYQKKQFPEIEKYINPHHRSRIYLHSDSDVYLYLALPFPKEFILVKLSENMTIYLYSKQGKMPQTIQDLDDVFDYYLNFFEQSVLEQIEKVQIEEKNIDGEASKEEIQELLNINKDCIFIRKELENTLEILKYFKSQFNDYFHEHDFINLQIDIKDLIFKIESTQTSINTLTSVSDLLYSQKQNNYMKKLTIVALLFSIPTFITSFYGMNIMLPFQNHPNVIFILLSLNLILTIAMIVIIRKMDD